MDADDPLFFCLCAYCSFAFLCDEQGYQCCGRPACERKHAEAMRWLDLAKARHALRRKQAGFA